MNSTPLAGFAIQERPKTGFWERTLVPLDESDSSEWAVARARPILERPGISVTLLRVIQSRDARSSELFFRTDSRHTEGLERIRLKYLDRSVDARIQLCFGDPATQILREIVDARHDLVVMSTPTGPSPETVAETVLHTSPAPVLFVPHGKGPIDSSPKFKRLLVVLDGLEAAEEIIPIVENVAREFGSELHLFGAVFGGSRESARLRDAEEYFGKRGTALARRGLTSHVHVRTGPIAEEALALIRDLGLDSVALLTQDRSGLARSVGGNPLHRLIRDAGVPVLATGHRRLRPRPRVPSTDHQQLWID